MPRKTIIIAALIMGCFFCALYLVRVHTVTAAATSAPLAGPLFMDVSPQAPCVPAGDGFVCANSQGEILVFDAMDARPQRHKLSRHPVSAPVLEHNGVFYVGDESGEFFAFKPSQGILWSFKCGNQITGGAIMANGLIWVGSHDQSLYALEPDSGRAVHEIECNAQINASPVYSAQANAVIIGSCDGLLRKIDLEAAHVSATLDLGAPIPAAPLLDAGMLFAVTHNGVLAAIEPDNLSIIWKVETATATLAPLAASEKHVFAVASTGELFVHNRSDGSIAATLETPHALTAPAVAGETLFSISSDGFLYRFSQGESGWKTAMLHAFQTDFRLRAAIINNLLVFPDNNGTVFYYSLITQD